MGSIFFLRDLFSTLLLLLTKSKNDASVAVASISLL